MFPVFRSFAIFGRCSIKMADKNRCSDGGYPLTIVIPDLYGNAMNCDPCFMEKPLAELLQCELLMQAEKEYNVITQMGNQGHLEANYFRFKTGRDAKYIKMLQQQ